VSSGVIRLVVKSRRRLVRDAICACLAGQPGFTVVGHTGAVEAIAELCLLRRPDAVLADVVELTAKTVGSLARARTAAPAAEIVVSYAEASPRAIEVAVGAGLTALVPGSRGLDAVLQVLRDRCHAGRPRRPDGRALTEYDLCIVSLLRSGHSVPEMAALLEISPNTVENHKRRLYLKLRVSSSGQAVSRANSFGLMDSPELAGPPAPDSRNQPPTLTGREADVLAAIASGNTIRQTGRLLGVTPKAVENTLARLYLKLGARNRAEALTVAYRLGLLDDPAVPPPSRLSVPLGES
jgi:DNA-binding NarL/FixJ family response regulator